MKHSALFLLLVAVLSGCSTVESMRKSIRDGQRPQEGAEVLQYRKLFEAGRRAESNGDIRVARDTYGWLISRGSRYGEYGLAMLLLRREPSSKDAAKNLISCAKRSSHTSDLFPDSAMDSAFSVAAMAKLSDIAVSEYDRLDVAESFRGVMFGLVTPQVRAWADEMKADADYAAIYGDVISAVESCRQSDEFVKVFKWSEISGIFMNEDFTSASAVGEKGCLADSQYSIVRFVKASDSSCKYDFEVRLSGNDTFELDEKVRSAIRRQLVKEFLSENPHDGADDVKISFSSWNHMESTIKGSAVVVKVSAVRIEYDAVVRSGRIAVRLDGKDVANARNWVLENIAELVAGKHVALVVGQPPPPSATFKIGSERMTEDGLLEIEFKTLD